MKGMAYVQIGKQTPAAGNSIVGILQVQHEVGCNLEALEGQYGKYVSLFRYRFL
jgi:hypothetical protein